MRIANFQIAVAFQVEPEIILALGPSIRALSSRVQGQLHDVVVGDPDVPPDLPRIVIQSKQFLIKISLSRFDIHATPPKQVQGNAAASFQFAETVATDVFTELLKHPVNYEWCGLVTHIKYPNEKPLASASMTVEPVFKKIIGVQQSGKPLSSFELRFGYQEGDLFRSVKLNGYAQQNLKVRPVSGSEQLPTGLSVEGSELAETGVQVELDLNNKPSAEKKTALADLQRLFAVSGKSITTLPDELNLKEILK